MDKTIGGDVEIEGISVETLVKGDIVVEIFDKGNLLVSVASTLEVTFSSVNSICVP